MKNLRPLVAALATSALLASAAPTLAQQAMGGMMSGSSNPMVGGHAMSSTKDIVSNAVTSDDNTILVAAVKAAGLVPTLQGKGPFTVFAPTDAAFKGLPAGTVDTLVKPENKGTLTNILTYHVVAGRFDFAALQTMIAAGKGKAQLKTVQGETLTAEMNGPRNIVLVDAKGAVAQISTYDVYQSNGVIHVIDKVLAP